MSLPSEDRQRAEFNKFTKFFTCRLVQAVVQSRLGQRVVTESSVQPDGSAWFNVRVEELGEVTNEIRLATRGRYPPQATSFCLDFQLHTADGDLPLESWCISFDEARADPSVDVCRHLYHQFGTLLKSAIAASRVTPAYRYYARRQGADSFIICYEMYEGAPALQQLGDGRRCVQLGHLVSPFGTLSLALHFRTKMVISDRSEVAESRIVVGASPSTQTTPPKPVRRQLGADEESLLPPESPPDHCFSTFSASPGSADLPWFPQPQQKARATSAGDCEASADGGGHESLAKRNSSSGAIFAMDMSGSASTPRSLPEAASHPQMRRRESFPFAALLSSASAPVVTAAVTTVDEPPEVAVAPPPPPPPELVEPSTSAAQSTATADELDSSDDSFVKVPSSAFGAPEHHLASFMRECKAAPPLLKSFHTPSPPAAVDPTAGDISNNLKQFEASQQAYEKFVHSLHISNDSDEEDDDAAK